MIIALIIALCIGLIIFFLGLSLLVIDKQSREVTQDTIQIPQEDFCVKNKTQGLQDNPNIKNSAKLQDSPTVKDAEQLEQDSLICNNITQLEQDSLVDDNNTTQLEQGSLVDNATQQKQDNLSVEDIKESKSYIFAIYLGGQGLILSSVAVIAIFVHQFVTKIRLFVSIPILVLYLLGCFVINALKMDKE